MCVKIKHNHLAMIIIKILLCMCLTKLIVYDIPVFYCCLEENCYYDVSKNSKSKEVYLLKYRNTTGTGWLAISSTDEKVIGRDIVLYGCFDPRWLKINDYFELDYFAKYIVEGNKIGIKNVDGDDAYILKVDKITIVYNGNKKNFYSLADMSFQGIFKRLGGIVYKEWRYVK